jgi:hypothetical protein
MRRVIQTQLQYTRDYYYTRLRDPRQSGLNVADLEHKYLDTVAF